MKLPAGRKWMVIRVVGVAAAGALGGFLYYAYVGCETGGCPITSSPWLTTGFGAAMGLSLGWPSSRP